MRCPLNKECYDSIHPTYRKEEKRQDKRSEFAFVLDLFIDIG